MVGGRDALWVMPLNSAKYKLKLSHLFFSTALPPSEGLLMK